MITIHQLNLTYLGNILNKMYCKLNNRIKIFLKASLILLWLSINVLVITSYLQVNLKVIVLHSCCT